jgi:DUF1365 family protein
VKSSLYECTVMHHRIEPRRHRFTHRVFVLALDLDEIDAIAQRIPWFSRNRANLFAFHDRDHLTQPGLVDAGVKANLVVWLAGRGVTVPADGRVLLVTMPRLLGYVFNPVSFYFVFDAAERPICAVAEVRNTFGELKPYLVGERMNPRPSDGVQATGFRLTTPKQFYVSPFFDLDLLFDFQLRVPAERLDVRVDDWDDERCVLRTALVGKREPLTASRLLWYGLKYPLLTLRVIGLIHAHAALLWLKRVPWHRKAANPQAQRGFFRPSPRGASAGR